MVTASPTTRTLTLRVVTPEGAVFDGPVLSAVVPSHDGETAFYPAHAAFVGLLGIGELRFTRIDGTTEHHFLSGGVVQVIDDVVTVLAESVAAVASLDPAKAAAEIASAAKRTAVTDDEIAAKQAALDAGRTKLRLAERAPGTTPTAAH